MNAMPRIAGDLAPAEAIDPAAFRDAMARLCAAVNIVTTDGPAGRAGFAATAVCSVTDTPPTLLVCLNRNASCYAQVMENGVVTVNTLAGGQERISGLFGGKTPVAERFAAAEWTTGATGAPALAGALVSFDCRVTSSAEVGSHTVLFCEVAAIRAGGDAPALLYFRRGYHLAGGGVVAA